MKKITLTLLVLVLIIICHTQSPKSFKYQAVARNLAGDILAEQDISFRISILEGSAGGTAIYTETHGTTTNQFGLANLEIGSGIGAQIGPVLDILIFVFRHITLP